MPEVTLTLTADAKATLSSVAGAMDKLQQMADDGTLDRAADAAEAEQRAHTMRRAVIDAALAGPPDGDYNAGLQIVVYKDGSFVVAQPHEVYELASTSDYATTISLAAITVAVAQVLN